MSKKNTNRPNLKQQQSQINQGFLTKLSQSRTQQVVFIVVIALLAHYIFLDSSDEADDQFSAEDYTVETIQGETNYLIGDRLKKIAHPDALKYKKKNITEEGDVYWKGKEQIAAKISEIYNKYNEKSMDNEIHFEGRKQYNQPHLSLINDDKYCLKSDYYHILHPESIYDNYLILTDFGFKELPREAAQEFGVDILPSISQQMGERQASKRSTQIPVEAALIHSRISRMHHYHQFNKNLFCTYQSANHIPGKWAITGKDLVIDNFRLYEKKPFLDKEKCWKSVTYMPESYRLYNVDECQAFFKHLDSDEYKQIIKRDGIAFIMKEGRDMHRSTGISLISPKAQKELQTKYASGQKCAQINEVFQIQRYINNPLLHEKKKIEVRIYFFIASTDPLIIFTQKLALMKKCANVYDKFDYEFASHVCNTSVSKKILDSFVVEFALEGLQEYLLKTNFTTNPNWLTEEIYPQMYRAITHLVRQGEHDFLRDSRVNENFAVDFLIDDQSKVWFLENNPNPQVLRSSVKRTMRHYVMFGDLFQIQFAYLRSRAKRLNDLAKSMSQDVENNTVDHNKYKALFEKANRNFLEPEFQNQIREDSSYIKIFDGSLEGEKKFMGYTPKECLYKNEV